MLKNKKPLKELISLIIDYFSTDREELELPYGCMHNDMYMLRDHLGPLAKEKTDNISNKMFNLFEELFNVRSNVLPITLFSIIDILFP